MYIPTAYPAGQKSIAGTKFDVYYFVDPSTKVFSGVSCMAFMRKVDFSKAFANTVDFWENFYGVNFSVTGGGTSAKPAAGKASAKTAKAQITIELGDGSSLEKGMWYLNVSILPLE